MLQTIVNNQLSDASQVNQLIALTTGGQLFDAKNGYGAAGDGITDDTSAIQAAINACQVVGGGIVFIPSGTYLVSSSLSLTGDNIVIKGAGWNTIIRAANNLNADIIKTPTTAGSIRNYVVVRDIKIDGNRANNTSGNCIHFYGTRYSRIENCFIVNATDHCINMDGDATGFGYNNTIFNNVMDTSNGCLNNPSSSEANLIIGNQFKFADTNNMCNLTSGGYMITGNVFGSGGTYTTAALVLGNSLTSKVYGNRFDTCRHQGVKCNSGNQIIIGNEFFNNASATSNTDSVIHIGANNNNIVMGNNVRTNSSATWKYAVHQDNPSDFNIVIGNQLTAGLTGTIQSDGGGTGSNVWKSNVGFNPQGGQSISVTASPFTYTNADSQTEAIYISAGTVSNVSKNSLTIFTSTNCTVVLEPGESVVVTYSSTPTMIKDRK